MATIVVVRPGADATEIALSSWAALVIAGVSGGSGVVVTDLQGPAATRNAVDSRLQSSDVTLYFGHGLDDRLGDPIALVDSVNISRASNKVVFGIACKAAVALGGRAEVAGVRAFLGFDDELVVYLPTPSLFGRVVESALIPFILSNASVDDVRDTLVSGFKQMEKTYRGPLRNSLDAEVIWLAAHINWRGVSCAGDTTATI